MSVRESKLLLKTNSAELEGAFFNRWNLASLGICEAPCAEHRGDLLLAGCGAAPSAAPRGEHGDRRGHRLLHCRGQARRGSPRSSALNRGSFLACTCALGLRSLLGAARRRRPSSRRLPRSWKQPWRRPRQRREVRKSGKRFLGASSLGCASARCLQPRSRQGPLTSQTVRP